MTAVVMGITASGRAHATVYPAPLRQMSERDGFDRSTRATAIARVRILAVHTDKFGSGTGVELECLRVLKGELARRTVVGFPAAAHSELSTDRVQGRIGDEAIVRLYSRRGHLELVGSPFQPELAMRAVTDANRDSLDAEYLAAVRRNTLPTMARAADLVVRGRVEAIEKEGRADFVVSIREHIAGPRADSILIAPLFPSRYPDAILLLARDPAGAYVPLNADNGLLEVEEGIVKRLDQPVDSVIRQIRMARLSAPPAASGGH